MVGFSSDVSNLHQGNMECFSSDLSSSFLTRGAPEPDEFEFPSPHGTIMEGFSSDAFSSFFTRRMPEPDEFEFPSSHQTNVEGFSSDVYCSFFNQGALEPHEFEFHNQTSENNDLSFGEGACVSLKDIEAMDYWNEETELTATSGELKYSKANQHQPNQVEISEGSYQTITDQCGRARLTPDQKRQNKRLSDCKYRQKRKREVDELTAENKRLKVENERSNAEIKMLTKLIESLKCKQLQAEVHRDKEHHGTYSGDADKLSGERDDSENLRQKIPINAVPSNRPIAELLLKKIEADEESNVCFSDFTDLDGESVKVGKYSFPLSLHPVVERIIAVYGDVSATNKMNVNASEATYILFCASVKEMGDLQLEQVTEDKILKWRDAIKDALRINLKVDFAMEHLKKITQAYIGRIERLELKNMSKSISKLEVDLTTRREELAKRKELSKYMDAAEEFNGKSLSLFP